MRISSATIDCYFSITAGANYTDFQHHHWEIMPSGQIGAMTVNNIPTYTWTVNSIGSNSSGSWSTPIGAPVIVTNGAQALITSPNTVSLKQTIGFGNHNIHANGSTKSTDHDVSEMMWWIPPPMSGGTPEDLITWSANAGTPSVIIYQDMGHPTYQLQWGPLTPVFRPPVPGQLQTGVLVPSITLSSPSVAGGRDWTTGSATFFQTPSPRNARALWMWTINLVP
jgi:hypothetical protein